MALEKKKVIQELKKTRHHKKELINSGKALGHIKSNSGEFQVVRMKSILTMEQLQEIELINDKIGKKNKSPFMVGSTLRDKGLRINIDHSGSSQKLSPKTNGTIHSRNHEYMQGW